MKMSNEEYERTQQAIVYIGVQAIGLDIPAFLERISIAESLGPVIDPTLWMKGEGGLSYVKALANAVGGVREELLRQAKEKGIDISAWARAERLRIETKMEGER